MVCKLGRVSPLLAASGSAPSSAQRLAAAVLLATLAAAACGGPLEQGGAPVLYDPCLPLAVLVEENVTPEQRAGVEAGIALWNSRAATRLVLVSAGDSSADSAQLPLFFQQAATPFHGLYDDRAGLIFINRQLSTQHERAVTVAHELGHAFGLPHVPADGRASVMTAGNLVTEPTASDVSDLAAQWGRCPRD